VIAKWIVGETKTRAEVAQRGIVEKHVWNSCEIFCRLVVDNRIERVLVCGWIRHKLITKSKVQGKVRSRFPIVLEVGVDIRFPKITVTVTLVGKRTEEQEGRSAEETRKTVKYELSTQPTRRVHIRLHALDIRSEPNAMRSASPINVVTAAVLVLNEK